MPSRYMHTIDGQPAAYYESDQRICFVNNGIKVKQLLVPDLKTLRRQQHISHLARAKYMGVTEQEKSRSSTTFASPSNTCRVA